MIDKLPKLRKLAEQHGLEIVLRPHGHVQVRGGAMTVNWYPSSKRRTAYCNGSVAGVPCDGPEQVIAMALGEQEPSMAHVARRASYKKSAPPHVEENPELSLVRENSRILAVDSGPHHPARARRREYYR